MTEKFPDNTRKQAAQQIRNARLKERTVHDYYNLNRTGPQYIKDLGGVKNFFSYVKGLSSNRVLDIGAGTTHGIRDLSLSPSLNAGAQFEATVLRPNLDIEMYLGEEHTHITSAEELRGIPDASMGGVLSVYSLTYSVAPELVVKSIDRVLVPGGAVKISSGDATIWQLHEHLKQIGYDVADEQAWGTDMVVLGIKPGGANAVHAKELLKADWETWQTQVNELFK